MDIVSTIRRWFSGMFSKNDLEAVFGVAIAITPVMQAKQAEWRNIVAGNAPWNDQNTPSLRLAGAVSQEISSRVALGLKSEISGSARADYLNDQYEKIKDRLQYAVIAACNGGEIIYKPYMTENGLEATVSETDCYWPVAYNARGDLIDVIFSAEARRDKYIYRLLERHTFNKQAKTHEIIYRAFRSEESSSGIAPEKLGEPASTKDIPEWANLFDITIQNIDQPLFVHVRMPVNDVIERPQRQGTPVWSKTIPMLRKADQQEARTDWEFEGGELAIDASQDILVEVGDNKPGSKNRTMSTLPKGKERLYRANGIEAEHFQMQVFSPDLRIDALSKRMNGILRQIEFDCGLSYGILSDNNQQDRTAEEFRSSKERLVTTVTAMQTDVFQPALEHLIASFDVLADLQGVPQGNYEVAFEWNESYALDRKAEVAERVQLMREGVLGIDEVLAYYEQIPLEKAQERLKKRGVPINYTESEYP